MAEGVQIAGEALENNVSTNGEGNDRIRSACDSHICKYGEDKRGL